MNQSQFDQLVERICSVAVTDPEASLVALGVDSLNTINLLMTVEEEFGVEIDPDAIAGLTSPADLWRYVQEHASVAAPVGS